MELTETHLELCFAAKMVAPGGIVIVDAAVPAAHELAEQGWLERRFDSYGELVWHWTAAAETALSLSGLVVDAATRKN